MSDTITESPPRCEEIVASARPGISGKIFETASLFGPVLILLIWEILSRTGILDARFFPPPTSIAGIFYEQFSSGAIFVHIRATLSRVLVGYLLGAIPGIILGLTLGLFKPIRMIIGPIIAALYPVPKIAIFPLILLIFGLGDASKYVIIAIGAFFLVFYNTLSGVLQIPQIHFDFARNAGANKFETYRYVALPSALPMIFTGFRLACGTSFIIIAAAEFIGAKSGLGWLIWMSWQTFSVSKMFVGIVVLSLLGYLATLGINLLEKKFVPWSNY